jgi:hypothetical protein
MLESIQESAPRASGLEHRKHQGHSQTGPGPAGADGGVAGAERIARTVALIPGRAGHQRRSCDGDRGAGKTRPSGGALDIHG